MSTELKVINTPIINTMIGEMGQILRRTRDSLGGEFDLTANDYDFKSAWLEDGEVHWDYVGGQRNVDASALTELCALYDTIIKTVEEVERDNA